MSRPPITKETTLHDACEIVAEYCPGEMSISIDLEHNAGSVELCDCFGAPIEFPTNHEYITDELEDALQHAEELHRGEGNKDDS